MRYALFSLALIASAAAADVSHPVAASVRRGAVRRVIVAIPAGEIMVRNGSADRINVTGEVQRSDDGAEALRAVKNANVEIVTDGEDAILRKSGSSDFGWRMHTNYHLDIEVPRGMSVNLETKYGEVTIEGEFGNIDVDLRAGEFICARRERSSRSSTHRRASAKCIPISATIAKTTKASFPARRTSSTRTAARASTCTPRLGSCTSR
ncbi:MAG TPA: hypothetical protein VKU62_05830 [Thermoanaerobaculia bacterium]|nr:hypothetical protein [Thermoanaerobaculia bacterium]